VGSCGGRAPSFEVTLLFYCMVSQPDMPAI